MKRMYSAIMLGVVAMSIACGPPPTPDSSDRRGRDNFRDRRARASIAAASRSDAPSTAPL